MLAVGIGGGYVFSLWSLNANYYRDADEVLHNVANRDVPLPVPNTVPVTVPDAVPVANLDKTNNIDGSDSFSSHVENMDKENSNPINLRGGEGNENVEDPPEPAPVELREIEPNDTARDTETDTQIKAASKSEIVEEEEYFSSQSLPTSTTPTLMKTIKLADSKRLKIMVTGGAGFVGSHLVDKLMQEGHEVIVVDNFFTGQKKNIEHWLHHPNFR